MCHAMYAKFTFVHTKHCVTFSDNKQASDNLMAGTSRQSSQGSQDEVGESIGTLSMVCDTGIIS